MASTLLSPFKKLQGYLALPLGAALGLVLYGYWFGVVLPASGRAAISATVLAALIGIAAFYWLLDRYIAPLWPQIPRPARWAFLLSSAAVGVYLSFSYLDSSPGVSPHYIPFLLPQQSLRISVPPQPNLDSAQIKIMSFSTALGDVSYGSLQYQGWTRKGNDLVLTDPQHNRLEWSGRTGDMAILTFGSAAPAAAAEISWNGAPELLMLGAEAGGRDQDVRTFFVPFYASQTFLLLLGAIDFIVITLAVNLLLWKHGSRILAGLEQSFAAFMHSEPPPEARSTDVISRLNRTEWLMIASLIVVALVLRVFNLNNLYPYADEYAHLLAAKALLQGAPLNTVFERSLLLTTIPVVIFQRLFGIELWSARLPGTIFNALAIIPLYFLARKINKPVAVLSSLLFAVSPWIIAVSRNIREYAAYPFCFYGIAYAMVLLLERLPDRLQILKDWKTLFGPGVRFWSLILILAPIYAVFLDARSTFKIIVIAYGVFGLFLLSKLDLRNTTNMILLSLLAVAVLLGGIAYAGLGHLSVPLSPHFNSAVLSYFIPNPPQQWYFDRLHLIVPLAWIAAGVLCWVSLRRNLAPTFVVALFLASAIFYVVFFGHYLRPRYLMIVQLWYVIVFALGLYGLHALLLRLPRRETVLPLLSTALFAFTFNISQSFVPMFYDKQGNMPITEEYHINVGTAYAYLLNKVSSSDTLLSNFYGGYVKWRGAPVFRKNITYSFITPSVKYWWIFPYEAAEVSHVRPHDLILSVVQDNDTGWIVLDSVTYSATLDHPWPLKTTIEAGKQVDYVGYFGGQYIWRWHPAQ